MNQFIVSTWSSKCWTKAYRSTSGKNQYSKRSLRDIKTTFQFFRVLGVRPSPASQPEQSALFYTGAPAWVFSRDCLIVGMVAFESAAMVVAAEHWIFQERQKRRREKKSTFATMREETETNGQSQDSAWLRKREREREFVGVHAGIVVEQYQGWVETVLLVLFSFTFFSTEDRLRKLLSNSEN